MPSTHLAAALWTCLGLAAIATPTEAQVWSVTAEVSNGKLTVAGLSTTAANPITEASATLRVTCKASVDCAQLTSQVADRDGTLIHGLDASGATKTLTSFQVDQSLASPGDRFVLLKAPNAAAPVLLPISGGSGNAVRVEGVVQDRTLFELATRSCPAALDGQPYDRRSNIARILVSPTGNLLSTPPTSIDENDVIQVVVAGDSALLPRLKIHRTSAFRAAGGIRIVGSEVDLSQVKDRIKREAAQKLPPCGTITVDLRDFAPGKGQIDIAALKPDGEQLLGSIEVAINPLYTGAFSLGVIRTKLLDPTFGLFFNGTDSVVTVTQDNVQGLNGSDHRIEFALLYTPFVWGRRDLEKDTPFGLDHINPTIGLVLNDVPNNFLLGASADLLGSIYLTAGAHAGRVRELDPNSGLTVGSAFSGPSGAIPTVRRWRTKFFVAATVDVRAAVQLLRLVLVGKSGA